MMQPLAVRVIDPLNKSVYPAQLISQDDGCRLERTSLSTGDSAPDLFLSPGWIDLHTHIYDGVTPLSIPVDDVGLNTGVHLVADAGSAGEATIRGLYEYVAPRFHTEIVSWLNISSIGLVHLREASDLSLINVDRTVQAVLENRPFVCGVKVRSSGMIVGTMGIQPLQLALLAAREAGVPMMVHIGEAPPLIEDVLDLLREGDVITHCFHGKLGHPWEAGGRPGPALERALARGVLLDVGHGAASFNFDVCQRALDAGYPPFSISTDIHIGNIGGPVYDLPTTMSKFLTCGMTLEDIVAAVTIAPAEVLRLKQWCRLDGILEKATLFRISDEPVPGRVFRDSQGNDRTAEAMIIPTAVITGRKLHELAYPGSLRL
ncbi:amidohydrolase/deacetylase family metallohydrolase [Paenibacillus spongiae]|uniref:Amidohydrolase/deacetylase family metallohydrolase n=1 Tax=Paenibacillus spongiae TaxID=2909671 RepID=A0ABY5SG86_9BACL|nr:amidohydrolase/deacetylase family metallohydrolase [Paenibacillus spongiae]UVI32779.1 amidohydrolase/deacetylase family metallohydrolase [Paenibacillus spongiae]